MIDTQQFTMGSPVATSVTILSDDQIKALPTTPVEIITATEIVNFEGLPSTMFIPVNGVVTLDATRGAYGDLDSSNNYIYLLFGRTDSSIIAAFSALGNPGFEPPIATGRIINTSTIQNLSLCCLHQGYQTGDLFDNSLSIAISNSTNLSGGHEDNWMKVVIYYTRFDASRSLL